MVTQECCAASLREETLNPSRERSVMPATSAAKKAGGRKEIGMVGAQTGTRERSAALAGAGTGG